MERVSMCYVWLPVTEEVGVVKYGESGYYQTDFMNASEALVDHLNERMGINKSTALLMTALSMSEKNTLKDWDIAFKKLHEDEVYNKYDCEPTRDEWDEES